MRTWSRHSRPNASVPETDAGSHSAVRAAQWAFEIPLAAGQGSAIAQFEIARDGHAAATEASFTWRVRFSVNVEPMGPVHALISLAGERAAVTLWVEREASAAHLRANGALLQDGLRAASLEPRDIQFRVGALAAPPPAAGRFLGPRVMSEPQRSPLAVALHYEKPGAPRVVAKGRGEIGRRIIEAARANGIPLEENPALAEALSHVELDHAIPEALYRAVAEVLAFILLTSGKLA